MSIYRYTLSALFIIGIHSLFNKVGIVIGVGCCWHVIREELSVWEEDRVWR